jgi:hypothetical protein
MQSSHYPGFIRHDYQVCKEDLMPEKWVLPKSRYLNKNLAFHHPEGFASPSIKTFG